MWQRFDVVFALRSPLHIGYLPFIKGSVISPTRYYVPGKNFWGAITKRATEMLTEMLSDTPSASDYQKIGKQVKDNFRFSYFYLYDDETIFIPEYTERGLLFGDDKNRQIDKLEFERRFIGSRVLTAINSKTGTAKDETLHEIEFIKDKFIDDKGQVKNTKIIGCIWVKENSNLDTHKIEIKDNGIFVNEFNLLEELTLGGEQGYGFGLVRLESVNVKKFSIEVDQNGKEINIILKNDTPILSHLKYVNSLSFKGELELLSGRGYFDIEEVNNKSDGNYKENAGKTLSKIDYYLAPGSIVHLKDNNKKIILNWNGVMTIGD